MNTHSCGARWTGKRRAHCSGCCQTFDGVGQFDEHRSGTKDDPNPERVCRPPASLGLVERDGVWMTPESAVRPPVVPPRGRKSMAELLGIIP